MFSIHSTLRLASIGKAHPKTRLCVDVSRACYFGSKPARRRGNHQPAARSQNPKQPRQKRRTTARDEAGNVIVPPALLLPTTSPHVFVPKAAVDHGFVPPTVFASGNSSNSNHRSFERLEPKTHFGGQAHPPEHDATPRFAFLGRSNVGKSSLLNALMGASLAVTSKQPGRTQKIHYYGYRSRQTTMQAYLVDMPGYGYAVGPDAAVQDWQRRSQQFLQQHNQYLERLFLLQDARVGPQEFDQTVLGWVEEAQIPFSVVLTKADGVRRLADLIKHVNHVCMRYHQALELEGGTSQYPLVHVTSSKSGEGLSELWSVMEMGME